MIEPTLTGGSPMSAKSRVESVHDFLQKHLTVSFYVKAFGVVALFILLFNMWRLSGLLITQEILDDPNLPARGQFGDSFGAINALFSGLALGGVIIAIWMQR